MPAGRDWQSLEGSVPEPRSDLRADTINYTPMA
jgi:hypothetical protein